MIARASGLGIGVGRSSRQLRGVGVLAMPDARLDTIRRIESACEVHTRAGVLPLLVPSVAVGVFDNRHCIPDGVEVTRSVTSATPELCREDEGVEF